MLLRLFLGSHGTLVAVSAPFMMPLRDSDIPMNVPFTFCNKQPLYLSVKYKDDPNWRTHCLLREGGLPGGSRQSTPFWPARKAAVCRSRAIALTVGFVGRSSRTR
jgi:hypothetical protein